MYQMYPCHPMWRKGDEYLIEPQLGSLTGLSGPLKITVEHGGVGRYSGVGLGDPSYLEPKLAGISEIGSPVAVTLSLIGGIVGAVMLGKAKHSALFGVLGFIAGSTVGGFIGNVIPSKDKSLYTTGITSDKLKPIQIEGPGSNMPLSPAGTPNK